MIDTNENIKWLYNSLSKGGYEIGSEEDFSKSLANEDDRKWYYDKARGMGFDMGSYDEFNSVFKPKPILQTSSTADMAPTEPKRSDSPRQSVEVPRPNEKGQEQSIAVSSESTHKGDISELRDYSTEEMAPTETRLSDHRMQGNDTVGTGKVSRNEHNNVNNNTANQEALQSKALMQREAPMRAVLNNVWSQAEQEDKAADAEYAKELEAYSKTAGSSVRALGPDGMPLPTAEDFQREKNRHVKRKETFNLEKIAENVYKGLPSSYRDETLAAYKQYFTEHPEDLNGKSINEAANDALKAEVFNAVYQRAVETRLPKSKTDFFMRKIADQPLASQEWWMDKIASQQANSWGMNVADMDAMAQYGQQHRALDIAGTVVNMAIDPTTYLSGSVGSAAAKRAMTQVGKQMAKGATKEMAARLGGQTLAGRIIGGVAGGATNFATFETMKNMQGQVATDGYNPETGENEGFSGSEVLKAAGHGLILGGATGVLSPVIGNVADKIVMSANSTVGKALARGGEIAVSTLAEGTVFSVPEWLEGDKDAFDVWTDNMAMMIGFKLSHAIKSAPAVISSLRPSKPRNGQPLTREERIRNRMNFEEHIRQQLDGSNAQVIFTDEEREELRSKGYGSLSDLFSRSEGIKEASHKDDGAVDFQRVESETLSEFDGYGAMERLMQDRGVSQAARAKAYYILTGRRLPMSTVTGYTTETGKDGGITVNSVSREGDVITSRRFSSEREAQSEIDNVKRQVELNTIDIGEQYRQSVAAEEAFDKAVESVSPGQDPRVIRDIYEAVKRRDDKVTESQQQLAEILDERISEIISSKEVNSPDAIRERIFDESGLDVDKILRKEPKKRTAEEQAVLERYAMDLFPKQEAPTPEQETADNAYQESRALYERFSSGETDIQPEFDNIAQRVEDAIESCTDVFGAESEYWMYRLNDEPWEVINDPGLGSMQKDAALEYINAKAALDGVMDAAEETAEGKKDTVRREVGRRTHQTRGVIIPATMKVDDKQVYIVSGDVVMFPDGTGVDAGNSSESIVILDEAGEYRFSSPDQIFKVGDVVDPDIELQTAFEEIDIERENVFSVDVTKILPEHNEEVKASNEVVANIPDDSSEIVEGNEINETNNDIAELNAIDNEKVTALSRIPVDEATGDPILTHESVDADTALDAAIEFFGSPDDALSYIQSEVNNARASISAAEKAVGKIKPTGGMNKYREDLKAARARVDEAKSNLAKWQAIENVQKQRTAEESARVSAERAARDAQLHDEAVARFEEEQRVKAEKQAEQEQIGTHAVHPKIKERWDKAKKLDGNADVITLPDGSSIRGRYVLTEAGAASASHDVNNAYNQTEGFPVDENGQSVNDRDYLGDKDAQRMVEQIAGAYDNRALQTPVIVSNDGVVLSGNNRTMSGDLAARQGTDSAYIDYLKEFGHKYGITQEQVEGMNHPRLVFVPDESMPYDTSTFARFNAQEMKSQSKQEAAVKLGKIVPDEVFGSIVNDIARYDRLSDYYADEKAVAAGLGALMKAGVINDKQLPEMRTGTALSASGKELIENTLIGKVFQSSPDAVRQIIAMPTMRQSVVMGLNEIANNRTLAESGYDLSDELAKAVDLVNRAKAAMPEIYTDGVPVSPFGRMQGLFDDEFGDSSVTDGTTLLLADILNSTKPSDLRKVLATYNSEAVQAAGGQMDMFSGQIQTKEDILKNVNEIFKNGTAKEKQSIVDAAIAERKQRAEAASQTPNAGERSEADTDAGITAGNAGGDSERTDNLEPEEVIITAQLSETEPQQPNNAVSSDSSLSKDEQSGTSSIEPNGEPTVSDSKGSENFVDVQIKEPTEAQKKAGNYKMEHRRVDGYNISIENPKGSVRRGKDADGKEWESEMHHDYGYIRGTEGVDGDHIDVFLSDTPEDGDVFVIDQRNEDGSFDEHKVMYGFPSEEAAREAYLSNYEQGWTGLGVITQVSKEEFKKWVQSSKRKTKPFSEYKSVKAVGGSNIPMPANEIKPEATPAPYTITPSTYTNKAGKTTPMHSIKFSTPPTYEQRKALAAFAREKADGRKSRGWCSDKDTYSEWLFRSEEDARKAGEMIADQSGEAVADALPMTAEEFREAVAPAPSTEKPAKQERKPKKAPINRVSLEDVMTDLSTKGETKLNDHAEPIKAEPDVQHEISDDEMQSLANELRDLLGIGEEGDSGIKFRDPGELTPQERQRIQSAGIRLAMGLVERGTTSFPDYATKMVGLLGDKIRPWLKSFYEGARWTPGYENVAFTPSEDVVRFDVQNFDKPQPDVIAQAEMIVEERKASTVSEQAQKELIEIRNKNRKDHDKQTAANTAALAEKADAVASEAESIAEVSASVDELNRASELIDHTIEEIDNQLVSLGYHGHSIGDEVMWDRYGNGKWEKVKIEDFDRDGSPIFEAVKGLLSEKGDWRRVKAIETTSAEQEQMTGDLFGGLYTTESTTDDKLKKSKHSEKKTDVQPRPGTAERERGHEPQQNETLGESQRDEVKGTDGRGMGGRDSVNPMSDGGRGNGVSQQPKSRTELEPMPEAERKNIRNNQAERGVDYAPKGEDARIKANIEAIELAKRLLDSGETASPDQMAVLRKFSGWGGLGKAFNEDERTPNPTVNRLRELLGEEGYKDAVMSRNSAYYTPAEVIDTMWDIVGAMGFKGGNVLEGSAGIGNILGLMPAALSVRSSIHAVEIDRTTGGILSLLYPDAKVDIQGFEKTRIPNNSVDLAITNVPFVTGLRVKDETGDKDLSRKFHDIHDFCIAKNIRKLREGGIGIFITSNGTMDNSKELRQWIIGAGNADVVGAFRMHNKTFGGTGATSDIIVVRKRVNGKPSPHAIDVSDAIGVRVVDYNTGDVRKVKGEEVPIIKRLSMDYNKYFAEHPENMAGEMRFAFEAGETFRPKSKALYPVSGKEQGQMLKAWADSFKHKDWEQSDDSQRSEVSDIVKKNEQLGDGVKEGSMIVNSQGELCMARMGEAVPLDLNKNKVKGHTKVECFNAYTAIKKALADVLEYQSTHDDDKGLATLQKELNRAFDTFVRTYGSLHKNPAISFLRNDVDFSSILALETYSEKGDKKGNKVVTTGKTDIFSRRVIETEKEPQPTTIKDGILASLYKSGGIDVDYISQALGKSADEVKREIVKSGLGYENPSSGVMEVSYKYLSGNVREKLHIAQENNIEGKYDPNIKALEKVMPMTIPAHLIEFSLGSSWIEPKLYEDFVFDKTGVKVSLTNVGGTWFMKTPWATFNEKNRSMAVISKMCDKTIMGHELIEAAITNKQITVSKSTKRSDGTTETITDKTATAECGAKVDEIRAEFKDWARNKMQQDPEMSERIEQQYNELFNNYVPMSIPDEFVPKHFGGQVSELHGRPFALRPHQGRAVVRGTTEPILLAHEVGTGKTYTLITTAMEMRRLGTARKPMIVVQNATVGQFVESAKEIYPNAKVLTIEEADRTVEGRRNFYAKIKYNDWDMIVIPQSVFERIPDSEEREMAYVKDIIEEKMKVLEAMRNADSDGRSMIVRQAEKELAEQEEKLAILTESLQNKKKKRDEKKEATTRQNAEVRALEMLDRAVDDVENFDDMGIDAILVDEAHEYKHLGFATAMQRGVKGVDPSPSKKSQGVFLKAQSVLERNNGRNVIFATGTPISNTAAEIWTFMRYLMPAETMKSYSIYYFDDFVRNFGNLAQMVEFKTNGKFAEVNRFAGYVNLPELVRIWSGVADTVLTREAGGVSDKIPDMESGKPQDIYLPQTRALRSVMKYVKAELDRFENMEGKEKRENSHIPLTMYGIAKAAAVDARLVVPNAEDDPNSKTNATVKETLRSLKDSAKYKGTVAIFSDNYQNNQSGFNLYEDIRKKLIAAGVPSEQIVVIKSGMTIKKKLDIFEKVNAGEIRVIMGSTFTLGTGVNIQERLHTLIHVDAPNRPMDYTQRNGRALRQGNLHKDMGIPVRIIRFGVEDSLDVTAYQRLKTKGAIADSIMNGSKMMHNAMENRVLEEEEDSFGDMTAQLSGSEYAILKNQAEREVRSLTAKQKGFDIDQIYVHNQLPKVEGFIKGAQRRIEIETKNLGIIGKYYPNGKFKKINIGKLSFGSIDEMENFFKEQNAKMNEAAENIREGADNWTSKLTIDVDGLKFDVTTSVGRVIDNNGQRSLSFEPERNVTYSCELLGIKDKTVKGNRLKNIIQEIANDIVTGKTSRELKSRGEQQLAHYTEERRLLEERNGKEFPFKQQLAEAKERLAKYEEAMKKELAEKEAKYAEMDKAVDAATDISLDDDGEDTPVESKFRDGAVDMSEGERLRAIRALEPIEVKRNNFSKTELREIYNQLPVVNKGGREIEFYHSAFKKIYKDGGLFGQIVPVLDEVLAQSVFAYSEADNLKGVERPDGTIHKEHPNVATFDNYVGVVSIAGRDYYARLTVQNGYDGMSGLHSCMVTNVDLYEKATLSDSSPGSPGRPQRVAFTISNTESRTIPITSRETTNFDEIVDAKLQQFFERASSDALELDKRDRVNELSEKLGVPVRVIENQDDIDNLPSARHRRSKGYWSEKDGVVVVLRNNADVADVDNTVVHEVVGHKGLRALIGAERFDDFLGEVYNHASNPIRKIIDKMTDDMVNAEADRLRVRKSIAHERAGEDVNTNYYTDMAEARLEAEQKREQFRKEATEEYMADLGGRIGSEGFEKMSRDELTLWGKIKAKVQSFLDKFLRGLKIAKSIRLNDKDLSYILYKSWKNLRKKGVFDEAEDAVRRRQSGYDADNVTRFRDPGMGLEETITQIKAEAMRANTDNLKVRNDAMRAIGGNLSHLRQAMARQKEYDITTVKSVTDLAKILMDNGLLNDVSLYETKRILSAVNNVVGKQDVSQYVQKVMDIMINNQVRTGEAAFGRLLSIKGSRVDARGIEVQGELDPDGQHIVQVVKKSISLQKDDIEKQLTDALDRMGHKDHAIAEEAALDYTGLQIAKRYIEEITESKAEEKELKKSIDDLKAERTADAKEAHERIEKARALHSAGHMTDSDFADLEHLLNEGIKHGWASFKQYAEATNEAIRQNKIERAESYHALVEQMGGMLSESVQRAKEWREAEKKRVEEIHHNANSDMEGRPNDEHHKEDRVQNLVNNSIARFILSPLGTFDQMLRMFGKKNVRGEGYLWNRYMRGWVEATEKEYLGYKKALQVLDDKVKEVFHGSKDFKVKSWSDLFNVDRKLPKANVKFWDGGEMKEHELTQGNLLYLYMVDKMSDGRMKLRSMGITEDQVEEITNFIDPRFIEIADWMQDEFLTEKRNEYNEVHKRMFGASMAAIENYFPLKILANARIENVDVADDTTDTVLPGTSTGSIIKRRRNRLALDVTGANAFSVILDHIQQMERWAAFAEFNRDLNTLLSYKRFRNQIMNMSSVYGGGKTLWNNFRNVCSLAAGAYRPPIAALDKAAVNVAKGVTAAKVSFRMFTALKQFLSMPAYLSDSNPIYLAENIANPYKAWKWSVDNLPLFDKRWSSRMSGDPRLMKTEMDWKMWRNHIVETASRVGMSPNAFVDAVTVSIGAHAMYQTRLARYKRMGYDPAIAETRAKQDATILFNQTQQSSESAFLSTMQVDRSWLSVMFTVFRNSSMSYSRQLYDAVRNLKRYATPGNRKLSIEFMAKQLERDGIEAGKAQKGATQEYRDNIIRDVARVAVFGYILQFAWNLGAYLPYLLLGNDDEEKDKMIDDAVKHAYFGSIEGLTGGDVMSAAGEMWLTGEGNAEYLTKDMPLASDITTILKKFSSDQVGAINDIVNLMVQSGVGFNPQSLTDAVVAIIHNCGEDAETSRECALLIARILNCPQSQIDKLYFDEIDATGIEASKMTPAEIAERYARFKVMRGAPLTSWAYGDEAREKILEKYSKRAKTIVKERIESKMNKADGPALKAALSTYEETKAKLKELESLKDEDIEAYYQEFDKLCLTPDYESYLIVKTYKLDIDRLTKELLQSKSPDQLRTAAEAIQNAKDRMIEELSHVKQ